MNPCHQYPPQKRYTRCPNELLAQLTGNELLVYLHIASKPPEWDFSSKRICKEIKLSEKTVKNILNGLEQLHLLSRIPCGGRRKKYQLYLPMEGPIKKSIFDQCKQGEQKSEFDLFNLYLKIHDQQYRAEDHHIPIKDHTIVDNCHLLIDVFRHLGIKNFPKAENEMNDFLNKKEGGDKHFPVFVHHMLKKCFEDYQGFDINGEALRKNELEQMFYDDLWKG